MYAGVQGVCAGFRVQGSGAGFRVQCAGLIWFMWFIWGFRDSNEEQLSHSLRSVGRQPASNPASQSVCAASLRSQSAQRRQSSRFVSAGPCESVVSRVFRIGVIQPRMSLEISL